MMFSGDFPAKDRRFWTGLTVTLIVAVALFRLWVEATRGLPLYIDEAYYWYWSRQPDWGYFSKPPVIAWLIWLTTSFCGDGPLCVRLASQLLYPSTALLVYLVALRLAGGRAGFFAAMAFMLMPAVSLGSMVISTDAALLFFWALALYLFVRAIDTEDWRYWLAAGIACGFGLLSKYTMVIFPLSVLLFLATQLRYRYWLRRWEPWLAAAIALLIFLPNMVWNLHHHFATLAHTAHISNLASHRLHWSELAEFVSGQTVVFGPLLTILLVLAAISAWRQGGTACRIGLAFMGPMLLVIMLQALLGRANANWAAPAYVSAAALVGIWAVVRRHPAWLTAALALNLSLMGIMYFYEPMAALADVKLTAANDPYKRARGWDRFGKAIQQYDKRLKPRWWLAQDRELLSQLAYQLRDGWPKVRAWHPDEGIHHHFDLVASLGIHDMEQITGAQSLIYVSWSSEPPESLKKVARPVETMLLQISIHEDYRRLIYLHRMYAMQAGTEIARSRVDDVPRLP